MTTLLKNQTRFYPTILLLLAILLLAGCDSQPAATDPPPPQTDIQPASEPPNPRLNGYTPSVVVLWNEVALAAVRHGQPRPTVITRKLFMTHTAMFDAWSVYDDVAQPVNLVSGLRRFPDERTEANKREAVAQAAYQMLMVQFPEFEAETGAFNNMLALQGYSPVNEVGESLTPAGVGLMAARATMQARQNDGSNEGNDFADATSSVYADLYVPVNHPIDGEPGSAEFAPMRWQPLRVPTGILTDENGNPLVDDGDLTTFKDQSFLTPHWGAVVPFALDSGRQFRPPPPPMIGSNAIYTDASGNIGTNHEIFVQQVADVLAMSADLTDQQKVLAEYWADGPRSETPPGHWNALAHGISERDGHSIDEDIRFYFALNCALFDAGISAWEAKRHYDYVRPISAVQHLYAGEMIEAWSGPNEGTQLIPAEAWRPYQQADFVTPPFAEYVSGHSVFSASAAEVFSRFTRSDRFYDGETVLYHADFNRDGVPDMLGEHIVPINGNLFEKSPSQVVVLRWETFKEAADEAGLSRLYGGIHFAEGDLNGRIMGEQIGEQAFVLAETYWQGGE